MPKKQKKQQEDPKEPALEFEGVVQEALPSALFRIILDDRPDLPIIAHVSGKIRMNRIKVIPGDRVIVEMSPYDLTKARITYRYKG